MKKRVWIFLLFVFLAGLGVAWVRWGVPRVERRLHARIQSALTSRFHRPVHLDAVRLHPLFLAITLENLRVASEPGPDAPNVFACRRWVLLLTPIHRAERFPWVTLSFGKSRVEVPVVSLDALPAGGHLPAMTSLAFLPAHRLEWTGGSFHVPSIDKVPSFTLADSAGSAVLSAGEISVEVRGRTPWGEANFAGLAGEPVFFKRRKGPRWKGVLMFPEADLEALSSLLSTAYPDAARVAGDWKGGAEVSLTMEGNMRPPSLSRWSVSAFFKDAGWVLGQRPCPVGGRLTFSPQKAELADFSLAKGLVFNGVVTEPLSQKASFNLSLNADGFPLEELRGRFPWKALSSLPWRGTADVKAALKGSRRRPELTASVDAREAGAGPLVFPSLKGQVSSNDKGFDLLAGFAGGTLRASAARTEGDWLPAQWEGHLEGARLEELARAGGWGNVGGVLGGDFALRRSSDTTAPLAGGVLRLDNPAWGDHRLDETLISYFSWRDGTARFHNKEDTVDIVLRRTEGGWSLDRLGYARGDGASVQGSGVVEGPERKLSFRGAVKQASLRDLPFLLERYPELEGRWDAEVEVGGTMAHPAAAAAFRGGGARLRSDAPLHDFRGKLRWEENAFSLDELGLDASWSAAAVRSSDGQWQLGVTARSADAGLVREVLLSSAAVNGILDGRLSMTGSAEAGWAGSAEASVPSLRLGATSLPDAALRLRWDKDAVRLESLGAGGRLYEGDASRRAAGGWDFMVKGTSLERVSGQARVEGRRLVLSRVALGDGVTGDGVIDLGAKTLEGRFTAKDFPAEALTRRFAVPWPAAAGGRLGGTVLLHGPLASPAADVDLRWAGAKARGASWDLSLRGRVKDGVLFVDDGRAQGAGGAIELRGAAPRDAEAPMSLSVTAEGLPVTLAGLPMEGALSGTAAVGGTRGSPVAEISLKADGVKAGSFPAFGARLEASFKDDVLTVRSGEASTGEGRWRLRPGGTLRVVPKGFTFEVSNDLRNVEAGPLSLFGGLVLSGNWTGGERPALSVLLTAHDLWVNQQVFDRDLAKVTWSGTRLEFEPPPGAAQRLTGTVDLADWPQLHFQDVSLWDGLARRLRLEGEAGPGPWRFSLESHGLEAGTLFSLGDLDATAEGPVDVLMTGRGSAADPQVEVEVLGAGGSVDGVPYDRLSATLLWQKGRAELRNLSASRRRGYTVTGRGEFRPSLEEGRPAGVRLLLRLTDGNLAILKDLWPECRQAKGSFEGELSVTPGPDGPVSSGRFSLSDGSFRATRYLRQISGLSVGLHLKDNRVHFDEFSGRSGRGRFIVTGDVGLEGFRVKDYDLAIRTPGGRGIPVEVPQLAVPPGPLFTRFSLLRKTLEAVSQGKPQLDITIKGPHGSHVVSGEIILDDAHFTYPPAKDAFKGMSRTSWWGEFWRDAIWNISLKTGRDTWYRNEYVNAHVKGRILLQGPRETLRVDGRVSADQGIVNYLSQPFQIRKTLFEVVTDTRPGVSDGSVLAYLSGEAERNATTLDNQGIASLDVITMIIPRAPLGEIRPKFVSRNNPGLSSERVFQRMLGFSAADPRQAPSPEEQDQLLRAGLVQLVGSSAAPFANRLARLFGIDMISAIYEPPAPAGEAPRLPDAGYYTPHAGDAAPGHPAFTRLSDLLLHTGASAGVRLSDRLFGVYKFKVDQTTRNQVYLRDEVQVVGRVLGSLYVTVSSELDGRSILGQPPNRRAMLEQQWRFGLPRPKAKAPEKTDNP